MSFDRKTILKHRRILKVFDEDMEKFPEGFQTDQQKGVPNPPLEKPYSKDGKIIDLVSIDDITLNKNYNLIDLLKKRKSHRSFTEDPLSLDELSYLLWATQGVLELTKHHGAGTRRVVPSGGMRHPYETYLIINRVEGLVPGIYRYLPIEHKLLFFKDKSEINKNKLDKLVGQKFILKGAVIFLWATTPYRMEWRYSITSSKVIAIEAGHICQNLYLACESIDIGTCAIAAYNQQVADELLELDGEDEFVVYLSPVGKITQ
ncbi:MAG: SagB/ThcOx family dehydrogenase [Candidatus Heimdallarchaeum endolithica]|uniref:SagB/ThcOx family dehydrogenase n=1 Tax=Candidatus Heimdallarchaeum endolithica TaxID=2876572 RepID=A0A9Y1BQ16_9ARCH|nr:MAG: SagB/ThcOx family dehydrogenase [Candidatus Heimdallarchaeum endolithica]